MHLSFWAVRRIVESFINTLQYVNNIVVHGVAKNVIQTYHFCPVELLHCHIFILVMSLKSWGVALQFVTAKTSNRSLATNAIVTVEARKRRVWLQGGVEVYICLRRIITTAHAQLACKKKKGQKVNTWFCTKVRAMSTGTRSKRSAAQEAGTPAKMAKISNHVGEVDGNPIAPSKTKGKGRF